MKADISKADAVFGNVVSDLDQISNWRKPKTPPSETVRWDRNPVVGERKGMRFEFFTIGALAEALGRKTVTIRSWEDKKIFPKAEYREKPPPKAKLPDKVSKGRRLYTRQQIEAAVAAAKASGVYDPSNAASANWAEFTRLVWTAWTALRNQPI